MTTPTTVTEFIAACNNKSSNEIYEMFEFQISESLRTELCNMMDPDESEPTRALFYNFGLKYNVQALIDY